jgi:hypothetical protein
MVILHVYESTNDRWSLDGDQYARRCLSRVLPFCKSKRATFQQDNAGCHVSRQTKVRIAASGVKLLDWPPRSPDMNPCEVVWSQLQRMAAEDHPMSSAELVRAVRKAWRKMKAGGQTAINNIVGDFDRRLRDLIRNGGSIVQ